ncbi:MAG: alpha/beta hydrolase [Actinomycetales bacterium]
MLDPELAAALAMVPSGDTRDLEGERARLRALHGGSAVRVSPGVAIDDRPLGRPGGQTLRVRTYVPEGASRAPGLLWIHGGAFAFGFAELDDDLCSRLAADAGYIVVSPDYRLAPEHPFPAGFDDVYAALQWLASADCDLPVDARCLAVGGSSAGGALAAVVAQRSRDEQGPSLALQILSCPVIDNALATDSMRRYFDTPIFSARDAELMWQRYLPVGQPPPRYAVPGRAADLSGLAPSYVLTADLDPLRDEGVDYARRMIAAGNQVELHHLPGTFHNFDAVVPTAAVSQQIHREYVRALTRAHERSQLGAIS